MKRSCNSFINSRIPKIRSEYGDRTVLIGGPPCQAYSLAGRSRNAGNTSYLPEKDKRNFLYEQYVHVLNKLEPAAFVMENVKGMLSSAIDEQRIFQKVTEDLVSAAGPDSYQLLATVPWKHRSTQWYESQTGRFCSSNGTPRCTTSPPSRHYFLEFDGT